MSEEQKDTRIEEASAEEPQAASEPQQDAPKNNNHLAEKRGRMVASAVLAAVVLTVIAVVVAGIFHLTAGLIVICPADLAVNDPAPILWTELEADSVNSQPLGVPKSLLTVARFKGLPETIRESGKPKKEEKRK